MSRYEITNYEPFNESKGFYLLKDLKEKKEYFVCSKNDVKYSLEIKKGGYIPKSGLIFDEILKENVKNKNVLDLGTGQLGFLAIHSLFNGAKKVTAVDIDTECIEWLKYLIESNSIKNIDVKVNNFFDGLDENKKFDIILSNPPQMPMINGSKHDSGGEDGRRDIIKILKEARKYLHQGSKLYVLMFDFLGTEIRTNNEKSIFEISEELGYKNAKVIKKVKKVIKKGSVTFQSLDYIKEKYPNYKFNAENGKIYFNIQIVLFERY